MNDTRIAEDAIRAERLHRMAIELRWIASAVLVAIVLGMFARATKPEPELQPHRFGATSSASATYIGGHANNDLGCRRAPPSARWPNGIIICGGYTQGTNP